MNADLYVHQGNQLRNQDRYNDALKCYGEAFLLEHNNKHAWNNYGNVLREIGEPGRAIPFLQQAIALDPEFVTANFNLAIANLLNGNYKDGFAQYEWRWQYEHLQGTLPNLDRPRWNGESLQGKTILVISEQGFGDCIQFSRFFLDLINRQATIKFITMPGLVPLFQPSFALKTVTSDYTQVGEYDYWTPMMSLPSLLNVTLENLPHNSRYIQTPIENYTKWRNILGPKTGMRIGICYSGRRDNWVNRYKGVPIEYLIELVELFPQHEWINLQVEPTADEEILLHKNNIRCFPGMIQNWHDTAGLVHNLDLVISIDTSIAHLAGAMGITTYIPLTRFAVDWRWGVKGNTTPWYPTARLFRQLEFGDWKQVFNELAQTINLFKL